MKPQRIRRSPEAARAALIDAAYAVLDGSQFDTLTVEMVTEQAGMTRSAFYHYFSGLDELALSLLEHFEQAIRDSVNAWLESETGDSEDYRQATAEHLAEMFEVMHSHRTAVAAVAQAASGPGRVFDEWQRRVVDYYIDKTATFIERQIELHRSRVEDPKRVAKALILMNNAVMLSNLNSSEPDDPQDTARVIADIWNATIFDRAWVTA